LLQSKASICIIIVKFQTLNLKRTKFCIFILYKWDSDSRLIFKVLSNTK